MQRTGTRFTLFLSLLLVPAIVLVVVDVRMVPLAAAWTAITTTKRRLRHPSLYLAPQQLGTFETLDISDEEASRRIVRLEPYVASSQQHSHRQQQHQQPRDPILIPYEQGWQRQQELWQRHATSSNHKYKSDDEEEEEEDGRSHAQASITNPCLNDVLLMLQHEAVYTLGTASDESFILNINNNSNTNSIPIQRINRGGEVTYHGPGQLTVYPVLDLRHYRQDIHWYVRALEQVVILALQSLGIPDAVRDDETTGVWVQQHKVAAVGVHARRWITQHGLAINVTPESLHAFEGIVPCGLHGRKVGCVQQFLPNTKQVTVEEVASAVAVAFQKIFCVQLETRGDFMEDADKYPQPPTTHRILA